MLRSCVLGPNVLKKAHIKVSTIITTNCSQGKYMARSMCIIRACYSVIVYPIVIPIIIPKKQLENTRIIAS